jgi:RNA polymerase sigma-70 factor (ECF subfamily)
MSSTSTSLPRERQMCGAVILPAPVSSELLRVLYITHHRHVLQICRKFFHQFEDAEDAAAEVFLKLYRVLHQKDEIVPFRPWISQIAAHHCIDKLRRKKHEKSSSLEEVDVNGLLDQSTPSALSEVIRNEAEGRIRGALAALPEKHRTVLVMRYYNRMSYSEIANSLSLPLSAVRVRIFRAKRFLRGNLRRTHSTDTLARLGPERKPEGNNDTLAINSLKSLNAPVTADIRTFLPISTSSGFYAAGSNARTHVNVIGC